MSSLTNPEMEVTHSGLHPLAKTSSMHIAMEAQVFNHFILDGSSAEGVVVNTFFEDGLCIGHAWKQAPDQSWVCVMEVLTKAGVKPPDATRRVERQVEAAIVCGQEAVRAEMHDQLMTKADGVLLKYELKQDLAGLRADIHKALNEQTWKLVTFVVAANGIMLAALKYLG